MSLKKDQLKLCKKKGKTKPKIESLKDNGLYMSIFTEKRFIYVMEIRQQARSKDFKRGGGEISNIVVFKKILKN